MVPKWVCINHQLHPEKCSMKPVKEENIIKAYLDKLKELVKDADKFKKQLTDNITSEIGEKDISRLNEVNAETEKLQTLCYSLTAIKGRAK